MRKKGLLLVFFTAIVSGFSIFLNSFGVKGFDSSVFTFSKNLVVGVLLLTVALGLGKLRELKALTKKQWAQLVGIGLVGGSIPFLLFFKGLQMTTGTTSAFIHKTLFIWASVLAVYFLKVKLSKGLLVGAALLLAGNYLFLRPDFAFSVGHALILVATLFWATENVWAKSLVNDVSGTIVAFGRMFFGSLFIFTFLLATGKVSIIPTMSTAQFGWIGVTSALLFLYVFSFYNGIKYINISTATSILVIGSPITTSLKYLFAGGAVGVSQGVGMILILGGVISVVWFTELAERVKILFGVPVSERD